MIECPFCNERLDEEDLVFEFNWGEVSNFFYNRKKLQVEPNREFRDRAFYVTFKYDFRGNPFVNTCETVINKKKHPGLDPMTTGDSGWQKVVRLLAEKRMFEVNCDDDDRDLPTSAKILPIVKYSKRQKKQEAEGVSTGMYCPICEQQLKPEVLRAQTEVRILLSGRPGSGKTVYATQVISDLINGHLAHDFNITAANLSVHEHYMANKNRLKAFGTSFVLATNPAATQDPYVYLMSNGKSTVRVVIQDIAGEDTENPIKYSTAVRKADMVLFFIDPWHIEEIRTFHEKSNDASTAIVKHSTAGRYFDLSGVFLQMMKVVDRKFAEQSQQLAGVLLVKGDYLNPPMLSRGDQPECEMMRQTIPFSNPQEMEFSIAMRSSFIRQCMQEWESTRGFAHDVESIYPSRNIRYFVTTSLGQSTHLRSATADEDFDDAYAGEDPDAQFNVGGSSTSSSRASSDAWDYDEQVLETAAKPEHVIDPIFWCLKRKGIKF